VEEEKRGQKQRKEKVSKEKGFLMKSKSTRERRATGSGNLQGRTRDIIQEKMTRETNFKRLGEGAL